MSVCAYCVLVPDLLPFVNFHLGFTWKALRAARGGCRLLDPQKSNF